MGLFKDYKKAVKIGYRVGLVIKELCNQHGFDRATAKKLCNADDTPIRIKHGSTSPKELADEIALYYRTGMLQISE